MPMGTGWWRSSHLPAGMRMPASASWPSHSSARAGGRGILGADLLQKMLLLYRPYEERRGDTEAAYEASLSDLCDTLESTPPEPPLQLQSLRDAMVRCRDRFRALAPRRDRSHPLI